MTCIVGLEHAGRVYIGGDSAGVAGYSITLRADAKVFRNGPFVMGFTSSFRMGQLLRYTLKPPKPEGDLDAFMVRTFIPAVRECLSAGGWLKKSEEREEGGIFLVGTGAHLFRISSDFQVGRANDGYDAVGCGDELALGSLFSTTGPPTKRIRTALDAASHHSAGVAAPYKIEVTRK